VEGSFGADATFLATQVIAKHDEVYTAPKAGATPPHRTAP
jgi:cytochrome c-type biogenesis protein CcmE